MARDEVQLLHGLYPYQVENLIAAHEGEQRVTLTVQGARIEGRVRGPDGEPPDYIRVWIRRVKEGRDHDRDFIGVYDKKGRFEFYGRRPGEHVISVSAPGSTSQSQQITVRDEDVRVAFEFMLSSAVDGK